MLCLACRRLGVGPLCGDCRLELRRSPPQYLPEVGVVSPAYRHEGPARVLVHHLKYRGVLAAARVLAEAMAPAVPSGAVLVPLPRVAWRRVRYGVDPALELAVAIGTACGRPVARALVAPLWGRPRAGGVHGFAPSFRLRDRVAGPVVLIDDVVTTGSTLAAAVTHFPQVVGALTATSSMAPRMSRSAKGADHKVDYRSD